MSIRAKDVRTVVAVIGCLTAVTPTLFHAQLNQDSARRPAISGTVVDASTGAPVAHAVVTLEGLAGSVRRRALTDTKGRFVFYPLDTAEDYTLVAERHGYVSGRLGWKPGASTMIRDRLRIAVASGDWHQDAQIRMWKLGSIEGHVIDEAGAPAVGATVAAVAIEWIAGRRRLVAGPLATADDRGAYRLEGLPPGRYLVATLSTHASVPALMPEAARVRAVGELVRDGLGQESADVTAPGTAIGDYRLLFTNALVGPPVASSGASRSYVATFHPAAPSAETATPVILGVAENRKGIGIHLTLAPTFTVSGRVVGPSSGAALLRLLPVGLEELGFGYETATAVTAANGGFRFFGVPTGDYVLTAQNSVIEFSKGERPSRVPVAPGFGVDQASGGAYAGTPGLSFSNHTGRAPSQWVRVSVQINRDVPDLVVHLNKTISVSGRVEARSGDSSATIGRPMIFAEPADGSPLLGSASTRVNADGTFAIGGLTTGRYLLRTLNGPLVASVHWRGEVVTDSGVDTTAGTDLDGVVVTVSAEGGTIAGRVEGADGNQQAAVLVFPTRSEMWRDFGWNPSRIRVAQTDRSGSYTITRLPAGDYFVLATDVSRATSWVDPDFLAAAAGVAAHQRINWGEKVSRDLKISTVAKK